jgi:hypothetical protein
LKNVPNYVWGNVFIKYTPKIVKPRNAILNHLAHFPRFAISWPINVGETYPNMGVELELKKGF